MVRRAAAGTPHRETVACEAGRLIRFETLEDRRGLSARAATAVNEFAADICHHLQTADGNIAFSPMSIATAYAMVYAGAGGKTAAEIASVFHFGDAPGIHQDFGDLIQTLNSHALVPGVTVGYDLALANSA